MKLTLDEKKNLFEAYWISHYAKQPMLNQFAMFSADSSKSYELRCQVIEQYDNLTAEEQLALNYQFGRNFPLYNDSRSSSTKFLFKRMIDSYMEYRDIISSSIVSYKNTHSEDRFMIVARNDYLPEKSEALLKVEFSNEGIRYLELDKDTSRHLKRLSVSIC